jgi:hypothetical protein
VIHAFALQPKVVARWARREEFRFIHDKFGFGTPRVLLELPAFSKWKKEVYKAANEIELSPQEMLHLAELFRIFAEHRSRRSDSVYDGVVEWLVNAEAEYERRPFAGIVASDNPRLHPGVVVADHLGISATAWTCEVGAVVSRTPAALAAAVSAMLGNCRAVHLVDPNFGPGNARHRRVLEALVHAIAAQGRFPDVIRVHSSIVRAPLTYFEEEASKMGTRLPAGILIEFVRHKAKPGGEKLHNRYILTDLGGVSLGTGLDDGDEGETDDVQLLSRAQYERRWSQYVVGDGSFGPGDMPASVQGLRGASRAKAQR